MSPFLAVWLVADIDIFVRAKYNIIEREYSKSDECHHLPSYPNHPLICHKTTNKKPNILLKIHLLQFELQYDK